MQTSSDVVQPCRAKVSFCRVYKEEHGCEVYERVDVYPYHNHERDVTILPNSIIFAINDYVTSFGQDAQRCLDSLDVANWLEQRFNRKFDYPSLFHYLSQ